MKEQVNCEQEHKIVKALKSGVTSEEISEHIKMCDNCRETAKVVRFFQTNLTRESPPKNLPAAGLIWWKSQLRERRRAAEQISQPITIVQTIAFIVFILTIIWLWLSDSIQFANLDSAVSRVFSSIEIIAAPFVGGLIGFGLVCLLTILALQRFMSEK